MATSDGQKEDFERRRKMLSGTGNRKWKKKADSVPGIWFRKFREPRDL
jgi:hypothetical protein